MHKVKIYTDGSTYPKNPGTGGWAARMEMEVKGQPHTKELFGAMELATNNQMEFQAIVEAVEALRTPSEILWVTDSVVASVWSEKAPPAKNGYARALHLRLRMALRAGKHSIQIEMVRGHTGDVGNERVHDLAYAAATTFLKMEGAL